MPREVVREGIAPPGRSDSASPKCVEELPPITTKTLTAQTISHLFIRTQRVTPAAAFASNSPDAEKIA